MDQGIGQITVVAPFHHAGGTVTLGQARPVLAQNHGHVGKLGRRHAQGTIDIDLARCVVDVVITANDQADVHVGIVNHHRKIVGGHTVGTHDDQIVELGIVHLDGAAHAVVKNNATVERIAETNNGLNVNPHL